MDIVVVSDSLGHIPFFERIAMVMEIWDGGVAIELLCGNPPHNLLILAVSLDDKATVKMPVRGSPH